jgi:hypothetical protein
MIVRSVSPLGRDKLSRAVGFINLAASGRLFLPQEHPLFPLDDVRGELVRFTGTNDDEPSDIVDTGSYMAELLPKIRVTGGNTGGKAPFVWASKRSPHDGLR